MSRHSLQDFLSGATQAQTGYMQGHEQGRQQRLQENLQQFQLLQNAEAAQRAQQLAPLNPALENLKLLDPSGQLGALQAATDVRAAQPAPTYGPTALAGLFAGQRLPTPPVSPTGPAQLLQETPRPLAPPPSGIARTPADMAAAAMGTGPVPGVTTPPPAAPPTLNVNAGGKAYHFAFGGGVNEKALGALRTTHAALLKDLGGIDPNSARIPAINEALSGIDLNPKTEEELVRSQQRIQNARLLMAGQNPAATRAGEKPFEEEKRSIAADLGAVGNLPEDARPEALLDLYRRHGELQKGHPSRGVNQSILAQKKDFEELQDLEAQARQAEAANDPVKLQALQQGMAVASQRIIEGSASVLSPDQQLRQTQLALRVLSGLGPGATPEMQIAALQQVGLGDVAARWGQGGGVDLMRGVGLTEFRRLMAMAPSFSKLPLGARQAYVAQLVGAGKAAGIPIDITAADIQHFDPKDEAKVKLLQAHITQLGIQNKYLEAEKQQGLSKGRIAIERGHIGIEEDRNRNRLLVARMQALKATPGGRALTGDKEATTLGNATQQAFLRYQRAIAASGVQESQVDATAASADPEDRASVTGILQARANWQKAGKAQQNYFLDHGLDLSTGERVTPQQAQQRKQELSDGGTAPATSGKSAVTATPKSGATAPTASPKPVSFFPKGTLTPDKKAVAPAAKPAGNPRAQALQTIQARRSKQGKQPLQGIYLQQAIEAAVKQMHR